jgi:hypothetical protein
MYNSKLSVTNRISRLQAQKHLCAVQRLHTTRIQSTGTTIARRCAKVGFSCSPGLACCTSILSCYTPCGMGSSGCCTLGRSSFLQGLPYCCCPCEMSSCYLPTRVEQLITSNQKIKRKRFAYTIFSKCLAKVTRRHNHFVQKNFIYTVYTKREHRTILYKNMNTLKDLSFTKYKITSSMAVFTAVQERGNHAYRSWPRGSTSLHVASASEGKVNVVAFGTGPVTLRKSIRA